MMAWLTGVVTYADRKKTKDGQGEYGILSVEGISMFCRADFVPAVGSEVRVCVQGQSRKQNDGSYDSSINALAVLPVNGNGASE